jgi:hypothetical protein
MPLKRVLQGQRARLEPKAQRELPARKALLVLEVLPDQQGRLVRKALLGQQESPVLKALPVQ